MSPMNIQKSQLLHFFHMFVNLFASSCFFTAFIGDIGRLNRILGYFCIMSFLRPFFCFLFVFALISDGSRAQSPLGHWLGQFQINDSTLLPFEMNILGRGEKLYAAYINGSDTTWSLAAEKNQDTFFFEHSVFETRVGLWNTSSGWKGFHESLGRSPRYLIPLELKPYSGTLFDCRSSGIRVDGLWNVHFVRSNHRLSPATGVFSQNGSRVSGSFMTETGDYRFLNGCVSGNELQMSGYDGLFIYLLKAKITGDSISGLFYSAKQDPVLLSGVTSDSSFLRNPYQITRLNAVADYFPKAVVNADLQEVRLPDECQGKGPVIIQLMGTWCPNCMDESRYLNEVYHQYRDRGLKVIGVSFERSPLPAEAWKRIQKVQQTLNLSYPLYYGGIVNADSVKALFPFMDDMRSYPTTIYLNKQLQPVKIHTGFNGPGTGTFFEAYKRETALFIEELLEQP